MSRPQRRPNKAITQAQREVALGTALIQRAKWPTDDAGMEAMAQSFVVSTGLHIDLIRAKIAGEDLRRRMRG